MEARLEEAIRAVYINLARGRIWGMKEGGSSMGREGRKDCVSEYLSLPP